MSLVAIKINSGDIIGESSSDPNHRIYYRFIGVPYAKITNIFQPSVKLVHYSRYNRGRWRDALRCFSYNIPAGDQSPFRTIGPEDLPGEDWVFGKYLFLNVYTPALPKDRHKHIMPIMVFIPGEHYFNEYSKSEFYDPTDLVAQDIVVVVVHYRTGILGFLHNQDVDPNMGLQDIIWALRWIQRNGNDFKGDINKVTIWGQGFGSVCISYLLASDTVIEGFSVNFHGLSYRYRYFHRVIMQSGTFEHSWGKGSNAIVPYAQQWMENLEGEGPMAVYQLLRNADLQKLIEPRFNYIREFISGEQSYFGPIISEAGLNPVLLQNPEDAIINNNLAKPIPILIGFNSSEGLLANFLNNTIEQNMATYKPFGEAVAEHLKTDTCRNYYEGDEPNIDGLYKMITDVCFVRGVLRMVKLLKIPKNMPKNNPIYLYKFSYDDPDLNIMKKRLQRNGEYEYPGACHGDELGYLFKTPLRPNDLNTKQKNAVDNMVKMWTNFAKTGSPGSHWDPVPQRKEHVVPYLNIAENSEMRQFENTLFLDNLIAKVPY